MSRSTPPVASVAVAALLVGLTASGCSAGFTATTSKPYAPSNGSIGSVGDIRIRNVVLVQSNDGRINEVYATFVDNGGDADQLVGVSAAGFGNIPLANGPIPVPALGKVDLGPSGERVFADALTIKPGQVVTMTFRFARAGEAHLSALVMTATSLVSGG